MNAGARGLFAENHRLTRRVLARLQSSAAKLQDLFPLPASAIDHLTEPRQETLDAFLKRFEQVVDLVENRLFRGLALLEGEDLAERSKRDITLLMERLDVVGAADAWSACSMLRNKLAHDYPDAPELRAERVNAAFASIPLLTETLRRIEARVRSRGLADIS